MHVYYMMPMFGVPYFEVIEPEAGFDPKAMLAESAAMAEENARTVKGKGSRRAKADWTSKAELCRLALADWSDDRVSVQASGAIHVSLARRVAV